MATYKAFIKVTISNWNSSDLQKMLDRKSQYNAKQFVKTMAANVAKDRTYIEEWLLNDLTNTVNDLPDVWMSTKLDCFDAIKTVVGLDEDVPEYNADQNPPRKFRE